MNLAGAVMTLAMLIVAERPPDEEHAFGHSKAEYFSSGFEGGLLLVAACHDHWHGTAAGFSNPQPLENVGIGLLLRFWPRAQFGRRSGATTGRKRYDSIALEADSHHL